MDDYDMDSTTSSLLDDIENDPINPYEYEMETYHKISYFVTAYVVSIAHLLLCLAILLASSLFFFVFYKFKRLQTRTNYILLHYFVSVTLASLSFTLIIFLNLIAIWHNFAYSFLPTAGFFFLGASFVFAFLLAQDWILSVSISRCARKYQTYSKWMIGAVYFFIAAEVFLYFIYMHEMIITSMSAIVCVILYAVHGVVIIVFNVIRYRKQVPEESKQTLYALNVASSYYLMWLLPVIGGLSNFIYSLVGGRQSFPIVLLLACLTYLLEIIAFSAPVLIVCLLARWDRNFKMAYDYVFKRTIRKYELGEDNLDEV